MLVVLISTWVTSLTSAAVPLATFLHCRTRNVFASFGDLESSVLPAGANIQCKCRLMKP